MKTCLMSQLRLTTTCAVCQTFSVTVQFECFADNFNVTLKLTEAAGLASG